jgi:hypothetical protein
VSRYDANLGTNLAVRWVGKFIRLIEALLSNSPISFSPSTFFTYSTLFLSHWAGPFYRSLQRQFQTNRFQYPHIDLLESSQDAFLSYHHWSPCGPHYSSPYHFRTCKYFCQPCRNYRPYLHKQINVRCVSTLLSPPDQN